jgi:hypothetical protein
MMVQERGQPTFPTPSLELLSTPDDLKDFQGRIIHGLRKYLRLGRWACPRSRLVLRSFAFQQSPAGRQKCGRQNDLNDVADNMGSHTELEGDRQWRVR